MQWHLVITTGQVHLSEKDGVLLTDAFKNFVYAGQGSAAVFNNLIQLSEINTEPPLPIGFKCEEHL